ncbi:CDP-4-keto-6-deoxy-D-glucose-3-dehydrase [Halogeometricum luteum]|uniref:CDP-4-keto-6-deoxy-D-glucose-3-dehydrase n=1 Tax=Halogeometricum luteum TaxID=2950537 RepID=A0ABU2FVU3_9EURY|nr:CDP-4-keto-6-deoxy-D-glucose-3-dehydrase [Halogeometricum sp. S3BR5-2]MDS0292660.1 CDP-4-keto-6-deoxy-D-glucose-3-dehydrase [Halogeometricum sp. S3BR5-2]
MLAIAGGKGGCGKTTTALGLAVALDGPTLVVDADADMPNLHAMAGVPRDPPAPDADSDPNRNPDPNWNPNSLGHRHPDHDGVRVCPAPAASGEARRTAGGGRTDDGTTARLDRVREAAPDAGTVLVDCPAGAGPDAAAPVRAADGVLLVASACAPSLRDAAKTGATARALGTPVVGAVLTRSRLSPASVESLLGCPLLGVVPPVDPPVLDDARVGSAYRDVAVSLQHHKDII